MNKLLLAAGLTVLALSAQTTTVTITGTFPNTANFNVDPPWEVGGAPFSLTFQVPNPLPVDVADGTSEYTVPMTSVVYKVNGTTVYTSPANPSPAPFFALLTGIGSGQSGFLARFGFATGNASQGFDIDTINGPITGFSSGPISQPTLLPGTYTLANAHGVDPTDNPSSSNSIGSVTMVIANNAAPPVTITVAPGTATLGQGQTQTFVATVGNTSNTAVTWSVNGPGTIDSTGKYTAPSSIVSSATATVTATSAADTTKTASATVTLTPPVTISVGPGSVTLGQNGTQTFTATVGNTSNTAVTWSVSGLGTIDSTGKYTAPSSITTAATATITATSVADPTKTASVQVTLTAAVTISISPTTVALGQNSSQTFTASVGNSGNTAVTWAVTSGAGSVDSTGKYTSPASLSASSTATVTATSVADTTKTASATVTLVPATAAPALGAWGLVLLAAGLGLVCWFSLCGRHATL
jgi:hypothetical protein